METDGVGVSLFFMHKCSTSCSSDRIRGERPNPRYISDIENCQELKNQIKLQNRKVVGVDPGKYNIVYMSDGVNKLRYTAKQRRRETLLTRNQRIRLKLKKESPGIIESETQLSNENSIDAAIIFPKLVWNDRTDESLPSRGIFVK